MPTGVILPLTVFCDVTRRELIYVMLPSSSAAAGDAAVPVTRGSSTSQFKGLSSYSVQQIPCREGGGFFTIITII